MALLAKKWLMHFFLLDNNFLKTFIDTESSAIKSSPSDV